MVRAALAFACIAGAWAMPGDDEIADEIEAFLNGTAGVGSCNLPECRKPTKKFEQIMNTQPGYQWNDAGGYCGSFSTQRAAMSKGAWISQQQVRDHTVSGGGNDNEILDTNIDLAWKNLKLKYESFDFRHESTPQVDGIRKFMKKQLSQGNVVVMMIQKAGHRFPLYNMQEPSGFYDHIVPFVGVLSDHALSDQDFYDDDYIVHYTDHSVYPYYRSMKSLIGSYNGRSDCPSTSGDSQYVCLNPKYGYGWAIQGFEDEKEGLPISLTVDKWQSEPDTRERETPTQLTGTLKIEGLTVGQKYAVYRWDSVEAAFDYSRPTSVHQFTASATTQTYTDPQTFISSGTTYYRCIVDHGDLAVDGSTNWNSWKKEHGREYSGDEEIRRHNIFNANMAFAKAQHNRNPEAAFGTTQFSDLTEEEFHAMYSKPKPSSMMQTHKELPIFVPDNTTVIEAIDWEKQGAVTTVKNQGSFGTCWSFATSGTVEGQEYVVGGRKPVDLAQQMLIDCCSDCYGHPDKSMKWILNNGGMDTAESYGPYRGNRGTCKHAQATVGEQLVSMQVVEHEADFMAALQNGPFHIAIDDASLRSYRGGVMTNTICQDPGNHDVLLVGAGEENGVKYWRVKNSWGTGFGESGYFRVIRDKAAMCLGKPNSFGSPATTAVGKPESLTMV